MDETRIRAVIREEIALAVKTLAEQTYCSDPDSGDYSLDQAASHFSSWAYAGACKEADEQRARDADDPFAEKTEPADPAVQTLVRAEVLAVLKEMRDMFNLSGYEPDGRIADRLDHIITAREQ